MNNRCNTILKMLKETDGTLSASKLAEHLGVSRQIIVGDIALLRASGHSIVATSRGYILSSENNSTDYPYIGIIACRHTDNDRMREELYTVVDYGGTVIDVKVEHAVYGELCGKLDISSRYEADMFLSKVEDNNSPPISTLTGGIHLHSIGCADEEIFCKIRKSLTEKGISIR